MTNPKHHCRSNSVSPVVGAMVGLIVLPCVLLACSSSPRPSPIVSGSSRTPPPADTSRASSVSSAKRKLPAPNPIGQLKLSSVTVRGLRDLGLTDEAKVVEWFNAIPTKDDPFAVHMIDEISRADGAEASMAALKLSSVTVDALAADGIDSPDRVATMDLKKLKDSRKANTLCRDEIASAFQRIGWTVLRAQITNTVKATQLTVNGLPIGPISNSTEAVARRFLLEAPGPKSAHSVIATLGIDVLNPSNGMPVGRWFRDITFERGGESKISIDIAKAPAPTIGFAAKTPLSPAAVYAGDAVTLTCEGGTADTVWFAFAKINRLSPNNYVAAPATADTLAGLPAWFRLRSEAERGAEPRSSLLDEPYMYPIVIGRGSSITWHPEVESPSVRIGALVRGQNGFWGFASRSIAVADLRPGIWVMPIAAIEPTSLQAISRMTASLEPNPLNIYVTHAILENLVHLAKAGEPMSFDIRHDEYRDASLPLDLVTIDFGDGSKPTTLKGPGARDRVLQHTYAAAGDFAVKFVSRDALGFERSHGTTIRVVEEIPEDVLPPSPPSPPQLASMLRITETPAESSFELFRRAAAQFARTVVARSQPAWEGRSVGLAHIHDAKDQGLIDIMDSALVRALLNENAEVLEREPLYQLAIDARGFLDSSKQVVPDQGGKVPDPLMQRAADAEATSPDLTIKLLDRIGAAAVPNVETVIEYKLKRAEVALQPAGLMLLRTARIFAWVRVHERSTMKVLFDDEVTVELGGTIVAAEASSVGSHWDTYPDGYMLRERSNDRAIQSQKVEVVPALPEAAPTAPPAPTPAAAPRPAQQR